MLPTYIYSRKIDTQPPKGETTIIERVSFDKGIFVYYRGAEFPMKGLSDRDTIFRIDILKALFIGIFSIRPNINSLLDIFNRIGNKVLDEKLLINDYMTSICQELEKMISIFLISYGVKDDIAHYTARIFAHLIEYDNAYRLRLVDIMSESDREMLIKKPRIEIKRLLSIIISREITHPSLKKKFKRVIYPLLFVLLIPKVKKSFIKAISSIDLDRMKYDDIDRYWACLRTDYDFFGLSYQARLKLLDDQGFSRPIMV